MSAPPSEDPNDRIRALPIWRGRIDIVPLTGGITNRNFLVTDAGRSLVVRLGGDIPIHGVMRFNEHAASLAAATAGISPQVRYAAPGILVIDFIHGRTLTPEEIRANRQPCLALVRRAHHEIAPHLRGPVLAFNVFHVIRNYIHTLRSTGSRHTPTLPRLAAAAAALEAASGPRRLVFAHNDLLAGNFLDDGSRLWLIDWDYAGFNTPLFDLGGLSSNNGFTAAEDTEMLATYFARRPGPRLLRRFRAITCASLLRETLWSMVSEQHSAIDFDYPGYTAENLARFNQAWANHEETQSA